MAFCTGSIASVCSKVGSERWPVNREEKPVNELFPAEKVSALRFRFQQLGGEGLQYAVA